jgi:MAF protein
VSAFRLVLASSSTYRQGLLQRFGVPFSCIAPEIDERPRPGEDPRTTVTRLAESKARRVAEQAGDALVIGSDQLAMLDDRVMGKPGGRQAAIAQLEAASGRWVEFLTGVCLLNAATGSCQVEAVEFRVQFRPLSDRQIENYVDREQPFDCAGGFKSEGLGISLFARMQGDDPTALVGLPLISLRTMLENEGVDVLARMSHQDTGIGA